MIKKAKLMADYQCWCIWDMVDPNNINPDTLPISETLKEKLHYWESMFDQTLDLDDHNNTGFKTEDDLVAFYDMGWNLLADLRSELPGVIWWYRDRRYIDLMKDRPGVP